MFENVRQLKLEKQNKEIKTKKVKEIKIRRDHAKRQ